MVPNAWPGLRLKIALRIPLAKPFNPFLTSNFGFDNCNPACFAMNIGPLGNDVRKAPIRKVSLTAAWAEPIAPPLIKSSVPST